MDSNKKKNSVRYKCQVRDINKKACLTRASTLTFVLSRKLLEAVAARAAPFLCNFRANFASLHASAKTQMQVKRVLCRRLTEPPFLLNDLPKTEGDTTEKIEKEGQE